jgi:hypothetical protein
MFTKTTERAIAPEGTYFAGKKTLTFLPRNARFPQNLTHRRERTPKHLTISPNPRTPQPPKKNVHGGKAEIQEGGTRKPAALLETAKQIGGIGPNRGEREAYRGEWGGEPASYPVAAGQEGSQASSRPPARSLRRGGEGSSAPTAETPNPNQSGADAELQATGRGGAWSGVRDRGGTAKAEGGERAPGSGVAGCSRGGESQGRGGGLKP